MKKATGRRRVTFQIVTDPDNKVYLSGTFNSLITVK